jgi:hypothetical protein
MGLWPRGRDMSSVTTVLIRIAGRRTPRQHFDNFTIFIFLEKF